MLNSIHSECRSSAEIHLNTKVIAIESQSTSADEQRQILVRTEDGREKYFDEVILTTPLGWLKRHLSALTPELPLTVTNAINHIGYGRLEKVYITFPCAFWQDASQKTGKPFIFQFLAPTYASDHNPEGWTIECISLAALPPPCNHASLLFYLNGPCSEYVTSLVRGTKAGSTDYCEKLESFFSPYYSLLANFDPRTCEPLSFCSTDWQNDELAGNGSYSTFQVSDYDKEGLVELDKDLEVLRIGCPERNLWFAGEHTAPTLALGTTTGAYWSGDAVAQRISRVYGMGKND